ncbi:MAG TPA: DUF58 domain-containing protein [Methylomirabilota bacterium]|nr:DUF58 domain-containing protein [Methylomirabilota bacterium]
MIRLAYCLYRVFSTLACWCRRRFTGAGLLVLAGVFVTAAIGIDVEQTVAYQLHALLVALLGMAVVSAAFFRGRFEARRFLPRHGTAGQPLSYRVRLCNRTRRRFSGLELIEEFTEVGPDFAEFALAHRPSAEARSFRLARQTGAAPAHRVAFPRPGVVPPLPSHGAVEVALQIWPLRRGVLRLRGLAVARCDPFGLFRGLIRIALPQSVTILPKRYPVPELSLPGSQRHQRGGVSLASSVGESEEFVSLRDYRPGDPLRRVHWKSWPRTGRLIVKEYQDEFFVRHALVLDTFAAGGLSAVFEEAVSVAASFACTLTTQESLLDLMFVGAEAVQFTAGRGVGQVERALELLASVAPCHARPYARLIHLVTSHARALSGCLCVLLDWDRDRAEMVRQLRILGVPTRVLIVVEPSAAETVRARLAEHPDVDCHLLRVGRIAEDLQGIGARREAAA